MSQVKANSTIQKYTLRIADCDLTGSWKPSAMLTAIQETSGADCEKRGVGSSALLRENLCWIVTHSEIHMERYPRLWQTVTVESFHVDFRRWFCVRCCIFTDENGDRIGWPATNWVILDIGKRQIVMPGKFADLLPDNSAVEVPLRHPGMVEAVHGQENALTIRPQYSDLDVNGHVTNTRYVDWVCDALGTDVMRDWCLAEIRVNYSAEIKVDQEIELRVTRDGPHYHVAGYHAGRRHFEMSGFLRKRDSALDIPDRVSIPGEI